MFENSHCAATYFVSDRRYYMDYKKEIIEMVENTENNGKLKFIYMILIEYLKSQPPAKPVVCSALEGHVTGTGV